MKPELRDDQDDRQGYDRASFLKAGALAVALGVATWLLAPILLPVKIPQDFPKLPDLETVNRSTRELLKSADREARRHPGSAEAMGKLGMAYHANLLLEQAGRAYRITGRLAPGDYRWVYCQASLEEENGNQKEQLRLLEQTLRLKPDHVPSLVKLADALFKLDRLDEAESYYRKAAQAPDRSASLQAAFGLGRVAARRRDWRKVIEYAAPLTREYAFLEPPYELLQEAYEAQGEPVKAAEARQSRLSSKAKVVPPLEDPLNEQLANLSYSSTRLLKHAGLLSHLGYPDRAVEVARRAAQAEPTDPDVRNFIARTLLNAYPDTPQAVDDALMQLGECLRLRPGDPTPLWMFAQDFFNSPKAPAAVERLGALMRPYAGRADAHLYLGRLADARGDFGEALSQYQAALKNDPNNSGVYDDIGLALDKAARYGEAVAYFQKSVHLNPMNATARYNLGRSLVQRGNDAQGLKELGEALRLKPDHAGAHFAMGFAFLNSRRLDEAVARFRGGLRYRPDDPEAHFGLGVALAMQHKGVEAIQELREALRLRPSYPEAQELLHQLER
jgi:tetratricopeptide (TPR) repeat protein